MNGLERRYAELLELQTQVKPQEVAAYRFERVKLRLAKATFYTPDFKVIRPDGLIEFHEVKGFWEEDARVKIKCAAEMYPEYLFVGVTWSKRAGWQYEQFGREE